MSIPDNKDPAKSHDPSETLSTKAITAAQPEGAAASMSAPAKIAAVSVAIGALIIGTAKQIAPNDNNAGQGNAHGGGAGGDDDESCGRDPLPVYPEPKAIYGIDGKHVQTGSVSNVPCGFYEDSDGNEIVNGIEIVDGEKTRVCFFTPVWAPDSALRLAGTVKVNEQKRGIINLEDGLLEINNISDLPVDNEKTVKVRGEASLTVTSGGRVSIALLPPETGAGGDGKQNIYVLVSAQKGDAVIMQEGRKDSVVLRECENVKVPLNIADVNGGCYVAEGAPGRNGFDLNGEALILFAGATFLALRRKEIRAGA